MPYKNEKQRKEYLKEWRAANPEYNRKWRAANPESARESKRKWRAANPEKVREMNRRGSLKWSRSNPEKNSARSRKWQVENPEKNREKNRKWKKYKRETDPNWKLTENMRSGMSGAVKGTHKSASTMKIIGCTAEGLFKHLESCASWEPWMIRKKYGAGGWDVDHIIPIKQWDDKCPLQFALCWDKSNLQPMEHIKNIKKGSKIMDLVGYTREA